MKKCLRKEYDEDCPYLIKELVEDNPTSFPDYKKFCASIPCLYRIEQYLRGIKDALS